MGFVEANPHSMKMSSLNGRNLMEVGESTYRPSLRNIKRRIVSAVRDFPPGCGRNLVVNHGLAASSLPACQNSVDNDDVVVSVPRQQLSGSLGISEAARPVATTADETEQLITENGNVDVQEAVNCSDLMSGVAVGTVETDGLNVTELEGSDLAVNPWPVLVAAALDEEMVSVMSDINAATASVSNFSGQEKVSVRKYPPRRHVSAVRDFPPFCGRNAAPQEAREFGEGPTNIGDKPCSSNTTTAMQLAAENAVRVILFPSNQLKGNNSEVHGDRAQDELKGREIDRADENDQYKTEMKEILEDIEKNKTEPPQESNECQGTGDTGVRSDENLGKQIVVYDDNNRPGANNQEDREIVMGLMTASNCPWRKGTVVKKLESNGLMIEGKKNKPYHGTSGSKRKKLSMSGRKQDEPGGAGDSKQNTPDFGCQPEGSNTTPTPTTERKPKVGRKPRKKKGFGATETANQSTSQQLVIRAEDAVPVSCYTHVSQVCLPPFGQAGSSQENRDGSGIVTRNKVRETLRLFQAVYRKLVQESEAKSKEGGAATHKRFDLQASRILKEKGKYVNVGKQIIGNIPGVEVGDEFHYRVELLMIGLHRQIQGGIDYVKHGGKILATSIVASGGYDDSLDNSNSLTYTGQGGNVKGTDKDKEPEDQKLQRGNLALKNSQEENNPVRVIRGSESSDGKSRTYVYDGLYLVEKCWQDLGPHNKLIYKFHLERIAGQPELAWKELKKSKKFQVREGICVDDISGGRESIPICAVNTIDDEKPPPFEYITRVIYPDWCRPLPPLGCNCAAGCSDSENCSCAVKNRGEIPYTSSGEIVEAKPLVYECGPTCECPPSCHNRITQHGIKFQLEIFKTESMGWGVRSLNSIPSGSFVCEYIGELLEEKEAEARVGNDEYLFDIGNNYNENLWDGLSSLIPDDAPSSPDVEEEGGFTIDAARRGNLGRFINHSCSPNLYAQNVLHDHEDNRIPHIMLFAAENIPPLHELTYHYNYVMDQVRDSRGNIKRKNCYCGSPECTGRLY